MVVQKKSKLIFAWKINDSYIEIEPTDVLVLNPLRTYHHFNFALETFGKNVRKYIYIPNMFKDNFPLETETYYIGDYFEYPKPVPKKDCVWIW